MTKLVIQIPCFNEAETLAATMADLPKSIENIDVIEVLIIDDGSSDGTAEVAKKSGSDFIVTHRRNLGLAKAFLTGLSTSIDIGADIIVNTDADNQYNASDIQNLVRPILQKQADIVIGTRPIDEITHFTRTKKLLQKIGSWTIRVVSNTDIPDAPSGFRAYSREAAMKINVFSDYTYTLETIIQAGQKNMAITSVPIRVNGETRESRLVSSIFNYIAKSAGTAIRIFITYRPMAFFLALGSITFFSGIALGIRFLVFYLQGQGDGHIQSLILASILIGVGFQTFITGVQADLIAVNRMLLEKIDEKLHHHISQSGHHQAHLDTDCSDVRHDSYGSPNLWKRTDNG